MSCHVQGYCAGSIAVLRYRYKISINSDSSHQNSRGSDSPSHWRALNNDVRRNDGQERPKVDARAHAVSLDVFSVQGLVFCHCVYAFTSLNAAFLYVGSRTVAAAASTTALLRSPSRKHVSALFDSSTDAALATSTHSCVVTRLTVKPILFVACSGRSKANINLHDQTTLSLTNTCAAN